MGWEGEILLEGDSIENRSELGECATSVASAVHACPRHSDSFYT